MASLAWRRSVLLTGVKEPAAAIWSNHEAPAEGTEPAAEESEDGGRGTSAGCEEDESMGTWMVEDAAGDAENGSVGADAAEVLGWGAGDGSACTPAPAV